MVSDKSIAGEFKNLDMKDQRILKSLFENGRKSFSDIAKEVRLSKESVNYRVKRMEKSGFIRGYSSIYDLERLGMKTFFMFIKFRNLDSDDEMMSYLKEHKNSLRVLRVDGSYSVAVIFTAKNDVEMYKIKKHFIMKFEPSIYSVDITRITEHMPVPVKFLWKNVDGHPPVEKKQHDDEQSYKLSEKDILILRQLALEARMPLSEMSERLGIDRDTIKYHMKKMEREGVIRFYRPVVFTAYENFGYNWYFITLKTRESNETTDKKLKEFLWTHGFVSYYFKTNGPNDYEIMIKTRTTSVLAKFLSELKEVLGKTLKRYEISIILEEHKFTYFPECLADLAKK